jgi:hypothetical protein
MQLFERSADYQAFELMFRETVGLLPVLSGRLSGTISMIPLILTNPSSQIAIYYLWWASSDLLRAVPSPTERAAPLRANDRSHLIPGNGTLFVRSNPQTQTATHKRCDDDVK